MSPFVEVILTIITASTPLLIAAVGELVAERSGVLNLGVEGMMVMGAVAGFGGAFLTGSPVVGVLCAIVAGMLMAAIFAFLTLKLVSNQVATGLALTLLGLGLSGLIGEHFVGQPGIKLARLDIPGLSNLPIVGPIVFGEDPLVYLSIALTIAVSYVLFQSRAGLIIRAVGDSHASAHALGVSVVQVRTLSVIFGGACSGLAGGYLSLAYTPQWIENMTAGRGWIALALVVFASWRPGRVIVGAYLFGSVSVLGFVVQAVGVTGLLEIVGQWPGEIQWIVVDAIRVVTTPQFLSSLPYLVTVLALVVISKSTRSRGSQAPACLGQPFVPDR
ncbi:MAG: ABC transporter permease [Ancalomicrobiaceae bacterium]|nr:ABC transporter permease [Ancalomicrobiaceae bacterium]